MDGEFKYRKKNIVRKGTRMKPDAKGFGGWVRIPWMFIARSKSGVQKTMYLENCISETHQAVNHRKEKIYRFLKKSKK